MEETVRLSCILSMQLEVGIEHIIGTEYIILTGFIHGEHLIGGQSSTVGHDFRTVTEYKRVVHADIAMERHFFTITPCAVIRTQRITRVVNDIAMVDIDEGTAVGSNNSVVAGSIIRRVITDNTVNHLQFGITRLANDEARSRSIIAADIDGSALRRRVIRNKTVTQLVAYHIDTLGGIRHFIINQHAGTRTNGIRGLQVIGITVE